MNRESGVTTVEYAIALAIMILGIIGAIRSIETATENKLIKNRAVATTGPCGDLLTAEECK